MLSKISDFNPLNTPLKGRYLLEASAGTGKTYTLTLLFLRLLLEEGLELDQILVLTFTRAATAELQDRIRLRLREALDHLEGRRASDDAMGLVRLLARLADPEAARQQLHQAIIHMDKAVISTIHGFCQGVLGDYALESGTDFDLTTLPDEKELRKQIIMDFWRTRFYRKDPHSQEQARYAAAFWAEPVKLLDDLGPLGGSMEMEVLPKVDLHELARLDSESQANFVPMRDMWTQQGEEIADILHHNEWLKKNIYSKKVVPQMLAAMDELVAAEKRPCTPLPKHMEKFCATSIAQNLKKTAKGPLPEHSFFQLFEQFFSQYTCFLPMLRFHLVHEARNYALTEAPLRKAAAQQFSFDDMLCRLDAALTCPDRGPHLASLLSKHFRALLIDEFQDTDPMQYRILSTIYNQGSHSLFLIGDPKQAIYSFRGADIFTYIRARRETPPEQLLSMSVNYRSSARMVAAVNSIFSQRPDAFIFNKDIPFYPVQAQKSGAGLEKNRRKLAPLQLLLLDAEQDCDKGMNKKDAEINSVQHCARTIRQLLDTSDPCACSLNGRAVAASDIAILVRSNRQAKIMERALRAEELSAIVCSQASVFASPEARQLARVLEALADLTARRLVRAALVTEVFGLLAEEIYHLRKDEAAWENWLERLAHYQQLWREQGVLTMLVRIFAGHGLTKRLSARNGGERSLTNYLHLAELLQQSPATCHSLAGQCRWLRLQIQEPDHDAADQLIRLESESDLIRILTIHRSKGLEFPLVFLPFAWNGKSASKKGTASKKPLLFQQRDPLQRILYLNGSDQADPLLEEGKKLADEEHLAEELRLFYVGITRAKYCCFLVCGRVKEMERSPLGYLLHQGQMPKHDEALCADLSALNRPDEPALLEWWQQSSPPATDAKQQAEQKSEAAPESPPLAVKAFHGRIVPGWITTSYSGLSSGAERNEQAGDDFRFARFGVRPPVEDFVDIFTFPQGPMAGTCLHNILEQLDFFIHIEQQQEIIADNLHSAAINTNWTKALTCWLERIVRTPLPGACCLRDLPRRDRMDEFAFLFSLKEMNIRRFNSILQEAGYRTLPRASAQLNGLMKGFIDLLFRFQGRYYIVDYKSNHLGMQADNYTAEHLETAMVEHQYHLQALIYTLALRRFLRLRLGAGKSGEQWREYFGGVLYLFLRGMDPEHSGQGIYTLHPDEQLIARLDACCGGLA